MPFSLTRPSACDLFLPYKSQLITAPESTLRKMLADDMSRIEQWAGYFRRNCSTSGIMVEWSRPGSLTASLSTPFRLQSGGAFLGWTLEYIDVVCTVAPSSADLTLDFYRNSTVHTTVTVPSGSLGVAAPVSVGEVYAAGDTLSIEITQTGSAEGMSVFTYGQSVVVVPFVRSTATTHLTLAGDGSVDINLPAAIDLTDALILMVVATESITTETSPSWAGVPGAYVYPSQTSPQGIGTLIVIWRAGTGPGGDFLTWTVSDVLPGTQILALAVSVGGVGAFRQFVFSLANASGTPGTGPTDPLALYGVIDNNPGVTPDPANITQDGNEFDVVDFLTSDEFSASTTQLVIYSNTADGPSLNFDPDGMGEFVDASAIWSFSDPADPPPPPEGGFEGWYLGWLAWPDQGGGEG